MPKQNTFCKKASFDLKTVVIGFFKLKTTSTFINSCSPIPSLHSVCLKQLLSNGLFSRIGNSQHDGLLYMFMANLGSLVPIQAVFRKWSVFLVLGNKRGGKKVIFQPSSLFFCSLGNCVFPHGVKGGLLEGPWCLRFMVQLLDLGSGQCLAWVSKGLTPQYSPWCWVWGQPFSWDARYDLAGYLGTVSHHGKSVPGSPLCPWAWGPCAGAILLTLPDARW